MLNTLQASKFLNLTRCAILEAIRNKRVVAKKSDHRWVISEEDLKKYSESRYKREEFKFNGELVFDKKKGELSVKQVASNIGCHIQKVYHACRTGKIKTTKKGVSWVISEKDLREYKNYLDKIKRERKKKKENKEFKNVLRNKSKGKRLGKETNERFYFLRRIPSK